MKRNTLIAASLIATLVGGAAYAAASQTGLPYPDEVKSSSVKIPANTPKDQASLAKLSNISKETAEAAAKAAHPTANVIESKLEREEGFLVWQVDMNDGKQLVQLSIDPISGQVLAAEVDEDDGNDGDHDGDKDSDQSGEKSRS